ncbi:migration and invasion inhibitory protein isoform X1 [Hippocampus comes]|uniref:Migration and invasion inhibitory protein n=1 Tax=Hippocampus comes TaxID=109280 RepID=A0A3Q2ZAQ4_HIPCM|nr:PREDICTED: migration and invasion-inhibitory protein isoform X1 [Hippocampus comes]XP_019747946.1 PREDICTED: migration and invasion-inhibitory protein isoform X1 [Hippocampus comes]XP_019747947.1 PREDICTED: migration and invasion-inhibitory protein isoform X1 [Hippocampus comes]
MGTRGLISSPSLAAQRARPSEISPHRGGDNGASDIKSCLAHHSKEQRKGARVTFQNGEHPEELASNSSHKLRPLLGYDWIAGVLDVEKSLQGRSDDFYEELQDFRMQNESECMHKSQAKFSPEKQSVLSLFADTDDPIADADTHQCTFLYKLNSRLFPVPVHPGECCPVCRRPKSSHPHTINKPALVRVSIPSSTLLPSYNYKAHRRSSFDSTDSLGLPSHCLLGWSNTFRSYLQPPSNLDLRSHLEKRTEQEDQVTTSLQFDQAPVLTPLPRHHFQHFTPKRKKRRPQPSTNS